MQRILFYIKLCDFKEDQGVIIENIDKLLNNKKYLVFIEEYIYKILNFLVKENKEFIKEFKQAIQGSLNDLFDFIDIKYNDGTLLTIVESYKDKMGTQYDKKYIDVGINAIDKFDDKESIINKIKKYIDIPVNQNKYKRIYPIIIKTYFDKLKL